MKKVLLINRGGSDNLGDQAIKVSLEQLLESMNCDVDFSDFTNIPKKSYYNQGRPKNTKINKIRILLKIFPVKLRWIIKNYKIFKPCFNVKKYDLAIIGGGQLINNNKVFALAMYIWVYLLKRKNIKVCLFGIGAMDNLTFSDRFFYRKALRLADNIYVRDNHSKLVIKEIFDIDSNLTYDVAFSLNIYNNNTIKDRLCSKPQTVLISVSHFSRYEKYNNDKSEAEYYKYWKEYIVSLSGNKEKVKLFYTTVEDLRVVEMLQAEIRDEYNLEVPIVNVKCLDDLLKELHLAAEVISPRMHALILARLCECKVTPVNISRKIVSFTEHYLGDDYNLEEIKKRTLDDLCSFLQ